MKIRDIAYYFLLGVLIVVVILTLRKVFIYFDWDLGFYGRYVPKREGYDYISHKTFWDWMLLAVPFITLIVGLVEKQRASRAANFQKEREQKFLEKQFQENTLSEYIDKMSELINNNDMSPNSIQPKIAKIARTRTLNVLRHIDGEGKRMVLRFLYESNLINYCKYGETENDCNQRIISLDLADFSRIQLQNDEFMNADFSYVIFTNANLSLLSVYESNLSFGKFQNSNLSNSNIESTVVYKANFDFADLSGATLFKVDLSQTTFKNTNLNGANLKHTHNLSQSEIDKAYYIDIPPKLPDGIRPPKKTPKST